MAPKKKEQQQKMSLGAFLNEEKFGGSGSWADEVEEQVGIYSGSQPLPPSTVDRKPGYSSYSGYGSGTNDRAYPPRDSFPTQLPTKPPYTAHLGNLSYEATSENVTDFFSDCEITSVRIIEDRIEQRPKGFAYAEFATVDGLKKALTLDGSSFQGRTIKVRIADPPKERENRGDSARDLPSWERKGPLADDPSRNNNRRPNDFGERRTPSFREAPTDDGKVRDFGNWERRGPLSPLPQPERSMSRTDSRPRGSDASRGEAFRQDRKASPATWGEGRQEGSRPREFRERPERLERAPTAAELDNQWRSNMRPDAPVKSPEQSREGSEAPPSPAAPGPAALATGGRPRLQLAKRTVSEAADVTSPSAAGDAKASPFGAARPIDTAAKEREIADKRDQALKEKKEAEEKAKEERRLAKEAATKEAATKEAAEKAAADAEEAKVEATEEKPEVPVESKEALAESTQDGASEDQKSSSRPKEGAQNPKSRAVESGNWRTASGEQRQGRGGYVNAPRGRGDGSGTWWRPPRSSRQLRGQRPTSEAAPAPAQDPDGWTTVPSKGRRQRV
ncbi:hypothetical protein EKO27_g7208 [Xylaria grammica]|uniref:RRM domain-containing protein n=1 Tax=Xylaria grammica TaxID=363999 RepID=A0A439D0X4_9PEZI|nr:hypothetical protein EKO27_g7208 [Xylaria grammica]